MNPSGPKHNAPPLKDQLKALWLNRVEMDTVTWDDLATAIGPNADQYEDQYLFGNAPKADLAGKRPVRDGAHHARYIVGCHQRN